MQSYKCANTGDRLADNEGIHFASAFVRIDRLGIGNEAADLVVQDDAVRAQ
jgi:hypothetical protein